MLKTHGGIASLICHTTWRGGKWRVQVKWKINNWGYRQHQSWGRPVEQCCKGKYLYATEEQRSS